MCPKRENAAQFEHHKECNKCNEGGRKQIRWVKCTSAPGGNKMQQQWLANNVEWNMHLNPTHEDDD